MPNAVVIAAHAPAPPRCARATSGPRTSRGANTIVTMNARDTTLTNSHRRELNACQPSRSSAIVLRRGGNATGARRSICRDAALTMNAAPSNASPHPAPAATTRTPPTAGPRIDAMFSLTPIKAFACCSCSALTVWGSSPVEAGPKKAFAKPYTACRQASSQMWAEPLSKSAALAPCTPARPKSENSITAWRGRRSDHTPPMRTNTIRGSERAARIRPRSRTDPVSCRTPNARATGATPSPIDEIPCPTTNSRNDLSPRTPVRIEGCYRLQQWASACSYPSGRGGSEHEQLDLDVGADVAVGDERRDVAPGKTLYRIDELLLHGALESVTCIPYGWSAFELDHRLLDIRVDAAEHTRQEIVTEHPGLGAHRLAVVVAQMQRDHRLSNG